MKEVPHSPRPERSDTTRPSENFPTASQQVPGDGAQCGNAPRPIPSHSEDDHARQDMNRLFTLSMDMMCVAGFDGYFKRVNPAWEKTLGYTHEELRSRPYLDFVHPEDRGPTIFEARKLAEGVQTIS